MHIKRIKKQADYIITLPNHREYYIDLRLAKVCTYDEALTNKLYECAYFVFDKIIHYDGDTGYNNLIDHNKWDMYADIGDYTVVYRLNEDKLIEYVAEMKDKAIEYHKKIMVQL